MHGGGRGKDVHEDTLVQASQQVTLVQQRHERNAVGLVVGQERVAEKTDDVKGSKPDFGDSVEEEGVGRAVEERSARASGCGCGCGGGGCCFPILKQETKVGGVVGCHSNGEESESECVPGDGEKEGGLVKDQRC